MGRIRNRQRLVRSLCLISTIAVTMVGCVVAEARVVLADSPAVTDFGQDEIRPALAVGNARTPAMFLTLYADGHRDLQVREVSNDAVVGFAGDHPTWRMDHTLSLFVQMPVYVRVIQANSFGGDAFDM